MSMVLQYRIADAVVSILVRWFGAIGGVKDSLNFPFFDTTGAGPLRLLFTLIC